MDKSARAGRAPVVRAGLKLLGEVGLEGLSLRRIAAELGVQAPTLYWRFRSKQDLVDEMSTHVLLECARRTMGLRRCRSRGERSRAVSRTA